MGTGGGGGGLKWVKCCIRTIWMPSFQHSPILTQDSNVGVKTNKLKQCYENLQSEKGASCECEAIYISNL